MSDSSLFCGFLLESIDVNMKCFYVPTYTRGKLAQCPRAPQFMCRFINLELSIVASAYPACVHLRTRFCTENNIPRTLQKKEECRMQLQLRIVTHLYLLATVGIYIYIYGVFA